MVGKSNEKNVFLSDIKMDNTTNMIHCNGLTTIEKGLYNNLWLTGSGDHINTTFFNDVVYQFGNLLIRNGIHKKFQTLYNFFNDLNGYSDKMLVTCVYSEFNFKRFAEFGNFDIILNDIKYVDRIDQRINLHFKPLFLFELDIILKQNNDLCFEANLIFSPQSMHIYYNVKE